MAQCLLIGTAILPEYPGLIPNTNKVIHYSEFQCQGIFPLPQPAPLWILQVLGMHMTKRNNSNLNDTSPTVSDI